MDGQTVQLVTGEHLRIDVDEFDDHVNAATRAEADGTPSLALEHELAAVALYRDHLHADLPEADWFALVLWGSQGDLRSLYGDIVRVWEEGWADNVRGHALDSGHHLAEEVPTQLTADLVAFLEE